MCPVGYTGKYCERGNHSQLAVTTISLFITSTTVTAAAAFVTAVATTTATAAIASTASTVPAIYFTLVMTNMNV